MSWKTVGLATALGTLGALGAAGCDGLKPNVCTAELRVEFQVAVESPEGLPVDSVTAENEAPVDCHDSSSTDGGAGEPQTQHFECWEQAGGTYRVTVTSGELTWTQSVHVDADRCHVTEKEALTFVLDNPDTADP